MERRLGRGLGSLLGQTAESQSSPQDATSGAVAPEQGAQAAPASDPKKPSGAAVAALFLSVSSICRNPDQPRKTFDSAALEELRQSVERHGVLQPIC
ncbi:MAG: ParB N-terminal domain-containing protein, partial [Planctomycetota bacterium]